MLSGGTCVKPQTSVGTFSFEVGLQETHLFLNPCLSLGKLSGCLSKLLLGKFAMSCSPGLEPTLDIYGCQVQFFSNF